jgi:Holliday junction resolvase RusA-like endonuclease
MKTFPSTLEPRTAKFVIPGIPIPKARPRFGDGRVYCAQKESILVTGITIQSQFNNEPLFMGPLRLIFVFYMPIAQKLRKKGLAGTHHITKPDISNLIKYYEDVCNEIIYHDDCIISEIYAVKRYSDEPRTELTVTQLGAVE